VPQVCDYISNFLKIAVPSIIGGVADSISLVILEEEVASSSRGGEGVGRQQQQRIGTTKTLERFVFQFQMDSAIYGEDTKPKHISINHYGGNNMSPMDIQQEAIKRDTEMALEARVQMERSMRDCLLQVLALRGRRRSNDEKAENLSFKLCLHVADEGQNQQQDGNNDMVVAGVTGKQCPELMNALKQGEWFQPEESSCLFSNTESGTRTIGSKGLIRPIRHVDLQSCGMKMQMGFEVVPPE
jgi:hypothetical protein